MSPGSGVLAQLVQQAADTFSPHAWSEVDELDSQGSDCRRREPLPNRVVLLGGPGQGKSTIGQFMAQYSRGRLLNEMRNVQSPETNAAVRAVLESADSQNIPRTGPLRYPFHVELPRYADLLSDANRASNHLSIVDHLAREISKGTVPGPNATTVIQWLKTIPSIIILDGLDEVPHSGNRTKVINSIEELLDVLHGNNADAFIFATSRPQGYQQELSPKYWAHWELDALTTIDAMNLACKVAPVLVGETTRRTEVLAILSDAAKEEATASLMTTPLQVMLLFHLVSTHNNIPKDRWTLFHRHYEILRDREIAKGGAPGATIRTYRTQIDRIHQDAGYLLHLRAEDSGGANAYFTDDEFRALVRHHLERDGFDDPLDALVADIANLATDRLVFLRSAVEGKIAFDVRSLQEFMAAGRLTASPEAGIRDRLYEIAGRAHWNLVFKIACSKIYASTGHEGLHDAVIGLLDALDAGDRASDDALLLTGSRLAIDLLLDGTMTSLPNYRRKLLSRAMNLVLAPESRPHSRLKGALDLGQRSLLEPLFIKALNDTSAVRRCTLRLLALLSLDQERAAWVTELLLAWWPADNKELFAVFDESDLLPTGGPVAERLRAAQWQAPPAVVANWVGMVNALEPKESGDLTSLFVCDGHPRNSNFQLRGAEGSVTPIAFIYCAMADAMRVGEPPCDALPAWKIARAVTMFSERPSPATAAGFLQVVRDQDCIGVPLGVALPWPLDALVRSVGDKMTCDARINELLAGRHGDQEIWKRNEESWAADGVAEPDIRIGNDFSTAPLDIVSRKAPPLVGQRFDPGKPDGENDLLALVKRRPDSAWARLVLLFYASRQQISRGRRLISFLLEADSKNIVSSPMMRRYHALALIRAMPQVAGKEPLVVRLRKIMSIGEFTIPGGAADLDILISLIKKDPSFRALIPSIADIYLRNGPRRRATVLPKSVLIRMRNDTQKIAASVTQLRVVTGHPSLEIDTDIKLLLAARETFAQQLLNRSATYRIGEGWRNGLLPLCREILVRRLERDAPRAYRLLQNIDEARPVRLRNDDCASALSLPPALPAR